MIIVVSITKSDVYLQKLHLVVNMSDCVVSVLGPLCLLVSNKPSPSPTSEK